MKIVAVAGTLLQSDPMYVKGNYMYFY